ncbi:MAG: cell filamentation protein Fic [Ignavibacteria bacterium RBG_16_36_9]|nr:MAG: cell filamentation protein Fic [Ignavibacteria bacterium RBG_16_36_9]
MSFRREHPFNDLPLLLPGKKNWETLEVYKKLADARAALAELKGRLPIIPNPLMLINTLVLQEAKDSSTIENIFTTNDALYKAFSSNLNTDPSTKEVLRYREALWNAFSKMKSSSDYSSKLAIEIFKKITSKNEGIRNVQVYIGSSTHIVYTPPEPGNILTEKLNNWFDVALNNNSIDPLIKMAMLHYQFEAIHPFSDGNGRTGRILNVLYLCKEKLIDLPVIYLSKYILDHKNDYYRFLREVTENGQWEGWILFMLEAVNQTAAFTLNKVNAIYEDYISVIEKVKKEAPDIYSHELIGVIYNQPYCKIAILEEKKIASRNTASKYLRRLEELGILASEVVGRETLYKNLSLLSILANS